MISECPSWIIVRRWPDGDNIELRGPFVHYDDAIANVLAAEAKQHDLDLSTYKILPLWSE